MRWWAFPKTNPSCAASTALLGPRAEAKKAVQTLHEDDDDNKDDDEDINDGEILLR